MPTNSLDLWIISEAEISCLAISFKPAITEDCNSGAISLKVESLLTLVAKFLKIGSIAALKARIYTQLVSMPLLNLSEKSTSKFSAALLSWLSIASWFLTKLSTDFFSPSNNWSKSIP